MAWGRAVITYFEQQLAVALDSQQDEAAFVSQHPLPQQAAQSTAQAGQASQPSAQQAGAAVFAQPVQTPSGQHDAQSPPQQAEQSTAQQLQSQHGPAFGAATVGFVADRPTNRASTDAVTRVRDRTAVLEQSPV